MASYWYALRSKPRKEEVLWRQLRGQKFEVFYPQIRVQPVNPRARKVRAYFPGYMFVQVDLDDVGISTFQWMPHAVGLVTYGGEPSNVPDNLINAIRRRVDEINAAGGELFDGLNKGDSVKVTGGPFEGYEGIFDIRLDGQERVRVFLSLLRDRSIPVELDAGQIEKAEKRVKKPHKKKRR